MKFELAESNLEDNFIHRRVSENGIVHFGIHRVLYGYRVRAGFTKDFHYFLDWCGGADWKSVEILYSACMNILGQREENRDAFLDLPSISKIKPFTLDPEFIKFISDSIDNNFEILPLEQPTSQEIKEMLGFKDWELFK